MKKTIISLLFILFGAVSLNAQSSNQNYVLTRTMLNEAGTEHIEQIAYFDGLGRPMQTVQKGITPLGADLVSHQEYDAFGRESAAWLPAVATGNNGAFMPLDVVKTRSKATYGETKAFALPQYEASPLSRVVAQTGPGERWHNENIAVHTEYLTNTESGVLACKWYTTTDVRDVNAISIVGKSVPLTTTVTDENGVSRQVKLTSRGLVLGTAASSTYYPPGELFVIKMTDEEGNDGYEFKDKQGQVLLTRQMEGSVQHDTYFVYDAFGNLRAVLPPLAADLMNVANNSDESNKVLADYAYLYKYDHRNRCIEKKLPGCEPVLYRYDNADRLMFTQDGEMREKGLWMFSIPDALGRVVLTGTTTQATDVTNIAVKASRDYETGSYKGYNLTNVNLPGVEIHMVNYYDDYEFLGQSGIPDTIGFEELPDYGSQYTVSQKGQLTGTLTAQFTDNGVSGEYLYSVMFYDNRGRVVQTQSNNHLGGMDKEFIAYNFTGQPIRRKLVHTGDEDVVQVYGYDYDHAGRLKVVTHCANDEKPVVLVDNKYDELGRIVSVVHNGDVTNLARSYRYNVRSWVTDITGPKFIENLTYNPGGNIASMQWVMDSKTRRYQYAYDGLSRLTAANYTGISEAEKYGTAYNYDKHGNIKTLKRYGKTDDGYGLVDNLTMSYAGNQMMGVSDTGVSVSLPESNVFEKGSTASVQYIYNKNGAMTQDLNKKITDISYNVLNLPKRLEIDNSIHSYWYAADGRKLRVQQGDDYRDYVGSIVYEQGSLKLILIDGGYIEDGKYYFYLNDHLGNNSMVADQDGNTVQRNSYYPFGLPIAEASTAEQEVQPYKYNGKEFEQKDGLKLYDYQARQYDAQIGRFTQMDPMAEKYYSVSPYAYVMNNPMKFVDPTGMDIWEMDYEGKVRWISESEEHTMYALGENGKRTGKSITMKDRTIFDNLTSTGRESEYSKTYSGGNPSDLASVFLFAADNSNVEWRFSRYDNGNGDEYAIGSVHNNALAISSKEMGFSESSEIAFIHSHPTKYKTPEDERESMGWRKLSNQEADRRKVPHGSVALGGDSENVDKNRNNYRSYSNYLTYFPHTGNIYQVRGSRQPAFIRNIKNSNNNPKRLFWGTLNGK